MNSVILSLVLITIAAGVEPVRGGPDDPLLYLFDSTTGERRSGMTQAEARRVIRFVRTIPGIDHRVRTVDALDFPRVRVDTGGWSRGSHGDVLRLRCSAGRYTLEKKLHWRDDGAIVLEYE